MAVRKELIQNTVTLNGQQAAQMMDMLTERADKFTKARKKAFESGDDAAVKKYSKELDNVNKTMAAMKKEAFDVESVLKNLNKVSLKDIGQASAKLRSELRAMAADDPAYKKKQQDLKLLNDRYKELSVGMRTVRGSTSMLSASFFKSLLPIASVTAAISGFFSLLRKAFTLTNQLDKSLSSLSAITGLTGSDLVFFKDKAIEYSGQTLKSANEIVKAFELVGSIRPELLQNSDALAEVTKQAIILSEATGGKLSIEDAAKAAAGVLNQFALESENAERVVNALAAGSKFGAANVVQQTDALKDFGAVAKLGNVSLEQSVGLIQTLAERQILGAEAGTKLRNVLIILQSDQENYKDGVFDINLALENLARKNMNVTELTKLFGRESVVAASILLESRDKVMLYTDAVTGTNTALEQQKIQNKNVESALVALTNKWDTLILRLNKSSGFLYDNIRFLGVMFDIINKNTESDESIDLFGTNGIVNDLAIAKMSLEQLNIELEKLKKDEQIFFNNWQTKTGEEKMFWAAQYDLAKENIQKVSQTITIINANNEAASKSAKDAQDAADKAKNEAEKVADSVIKQADAYDLLSGEITELEKNIRSLIVANKPVPGNMIQELADKKKELEDVNKALQNIAVNIYSMSAISAAKSLGVESSIPEFLSDRQGPDTDGLSLGKPKEKTDEQLAWQEATLSIAESTSSALLDIIANRNAAELDLELSKLDRQREAELNNKNLTEAQKEAINEKYRKKAAAMQLNAWQKQKRADIATSIIKTALAVLTQLAGGDPITAIPRAIAAGVAGAAQTAVIVAQKPPQFKRGGYTDQSFSNSTVAGIVHANEFVGNALATANPTVRPVFDLINYAQQNGTISSLNLPQAIAASSSFAVQTSTTANAATNFSIDASMMMAAVAKFEQIIDRFSNEGIETHLIYQDYKRMADKETSAINRTQ